MNFFSIFRFHYVNLFNKKNSLIMIGCLLIYCLSSFLIYNAESNTYTTVYFIFNSPRIPTLDLFRALLLVLSFVLVCTHFMQTEIRLRSIYILLRIKSNKLYFHSLFSTMILFTVIFMTISYIIAFLLTFVFFKIAIFNVESFSQTIDSHILYQQYLLLTLSIITLLISNMIIILLIKNSELSTVIFILLFVSSFYFICTNPNNYLYIPFLYGFFNPTTHLVDKVYPLKITILCFSCITLYGISYFIYLRRKDFFS